MLTPAFLDAARRLATVDRGDPDVLLAAAVAVNDHPAGTPEDDVERGLLQGVRA
ncbi:MAG: hypothetical protein INR66_27190, partial [Gordonia polyisoprenivorans]|nr:hypothetical protein [Gordonia polyisoprenivorans]